jgi:AAA domain
MTLKSIKISAFRGASEPFELIFEAKKKLTIIYGENGTGKTTICDAFEFLAKGDVGSLRDKGIDGTRHKYLHSAQKTTEDLLVSLETAQGAICTGKLVGKNAVVAPEADRPRLEIMRRKQMLDFVEATPGDRYKAISGFIDISAFEVSEGKLKSLLGDLGNEKTNADAAVYQSYTAISDIYKAAGNAPGQNPVDWAKALLAQPVGTEAEEQAAIDALIVQYQGLGGYPEQLQQRQDSVSTAQADLNTAQDGMALAAGAAAANANEIVAVLNAGQSYLHVHPDSEVCPLCESAERANGLSDQIKSRLEQFAAVNEAKINLDKCSSTHKTATANLDLLKSGYLESLAGYQTARTGFAWDQKYSFPESLPPQAIVDLQAWLVANDDLLQKWKDVYASLRLVLERRENARLSLKRYNDNTEKVTELTALIPKVEQAHTIVKTKRQEFTDTVINEIAGKAGELYELVHPGEGKNKIALELDHAKRASIDLNAEFSGKGAPPQAYFSQSHLDTLGLCLFLALAMREKPSEAVLILDDVLGSVDEPHVDKVIHMICNVTKEFRHTIITTHYGPWRHKYRWGLIKGGHPCQFVELTGSGLEGVIRAVGSIPEIDRLRIMVAADQPDLQAVVGKAGVVLEAVLTFMANCYGPRLPFRASGKHTLGELLPNIKGKLREALRIEIVEKGGDGDVVKDNIAFKALLDDIFAQGSIRNVVGAHFNTDAFDVPDAKALTYAGHVLRLAEAMICPDHGWPSSDKSGSHWSNAGGTRRMHPLREPT